MELSKVAKPGTRIEVKLTETKEKDPGKAKYYASRISDIQKNGDLEIYMPTDQGKLIVLQQDAIIDVVFYSGRGMYIVEGRVIDRYKDGGLFLCTVRTRGELKRHQRREHYRYSCSLNMLGRVMDGAEVKWLVERGEMVIMEGEPMATNIIADISGGGIRFRSKEEYPIETLLYCELEFGREYKVCCVVLDSKPAENEKNTFEYRAKFYGMTNKDREELIKYIFDLELQSRKAANR